MDLKRILKVYNYVNDEKHPKVNVKFMGLLAGFLVVGGLLVAFALSNPSPGAGGGEGPAAEEGDPQTDFVGLTDAEALLHQADLDRRDQIIQARLDSWLADHPEADIVSMEPHYDGAVWIGYDITYRDA
jgi:hypothetical protein